MADRYSVHASCCQKAVKISKDYQIFIGVCNSFVVRGYYKTMLSLWMLCAEPLSLGVANAD